LSVHILVLAVLGGKPLVEHLGTILSCLLGLHVYQILVDKEWLAVIVLLDGVFLAASLSGTWLCAL